MKDCAAHNRVYRVVWNRARGVWMVVGELAKGLGKGSGRKRHSLKGLLMLVPLSLFSTLAMAAPTGGQVTAGSGSITHSGSATTINQSSQNLSLSWKTFNVGSSETVNFDQPNSSAVAVNRIYDTNGSQIMGHINANGNIYLINPNGIVFGSSAQVNVGGLVASTLDTTDGSHFSGSGTGIIVNKGTINAQHYVALLGNSVTNSGIITAQLGTVAMGAGNDVTLSFSGGQIVKLQVNQSVINALVANQGLIQADGGIVIMNAGAKDTLLASVVNNDGVVEAQTVSNHNGTITLMGGMAAGMVNVGGTLDASAPNGGHGGFIETSAHHVHIASNAKITTQAPYGMSGTWLIDPVDFTIAASSGDMTGTTLSNDLNNGSVIIQSTSGSSGTSGNINVDDTVSWSSAYKLTLKAQNNININSPMNVTGSGTLVLDYGQASSNGGSSTYNVYAPVNLASGSFFTTQKGTNSANAINWTIIDTLGSSNGSTTKTDLQGINGDLTGHYVLGADIDAKATSTNTTSWGTNGFTPIGSRSPSSTTHFMGVFDGLGHTISNLYINRSSTAGVGLFGEVGGTVRNVGMVGGSVAGSYVVGDLVGFNSGGTISNAYATGSVKGASYAVGGLVGENTGTITDAYATGNVTGNSNLGGLVGVNENVGSSGTIADAYATGNVTGNSNLGGLVGGNFATIRYAYATGSISAGNQSGGLVGSNSGTATVTDGYWDKTTTGQASSAGSSGSNGLTTKALSSNLSSLTGFSTSVWANGGNQTTPYLKANAGFGTVSGHVILGSNTATSPSYYGVILSMTQLQNINSTGLTDNYVLGTNLDASATSTWNGGAGFAPIGTNYTSTTAFTGVFDGLNHTISNLYINRGSTSYVGLFGVVRGAVRNIGLVGGSVTGKVYVGELAGTVYTGTISNAYATGSVSGTNRVGGLVGSNNGGTITGSYATGSVTGTSNVGGLVGFNMVGTITGSYATGSVTGTSDVGGLVGSNGIQGTVSHSFWDITTTGLGTHQGYGSNAGKWTSNAGLVDTGMKTVSNFSAAGWSISSTNGSGKTWTIYDGHTYPLLRYFMTPLTVTASAQTKAYNGTSAATLNSPTYSVAGAATSGHLFGLTNAYGANAINANTYSTSDIWSDQQGYIIDQTGVGTLTVNPAQLRYAATAQTVFSGVTPSVGGTISGLVSGGRLSAVTSGSVSWSTPATKSSSPGIYAIDGSGLTVTSGNYLSTILQAAGNATALTLVPSTAPQSVVNVRSVAQLLANQPAGFQMWSPTDGNGTGSGSGAKGGNTNKHHIVPPALLPLAEGSALLGAWSPGLNVVAPGVLLPPGSN